MTRYPVRPGVPTENGWPMVNASSNAVVQVVPAAKRVPLRAGPVATILNAWIILYNRRVEPITSQVWGWSPDNDVWNSNHLSGTAIDIGAPKYPWGQRRMPAATKAKVRALLNDFEGTVFWGADWSYADEMHYQIGLPPSDPRIAAFAEKLNRGHLGAYGTPKPSPAPTPPEDDMAFTDEDRRMLREVHRELTQLLPSRSAYRTTDDPIDTMAGLVINTDARQHESWVHERAAEAGMDPAEWAAKNLGGQA